MAHTHESPLTELGYYTIEHGGKSWQVVVEANETDELAYYHFRIGTVWDVPPGYWFVRTPMGMPLTVLSPEEQSQRLVFIAPMQEGRNDER
jgi:hypothetical protein